MSSNPRSPSLLRKTVQLTRNNVDLGDSRNFKSDLTRKTTETKVRRKPTEFTIPTEGNYSPTN